MPFDHEKVDVYQLGLAFVVVANDVDERMNSGRGHLTDQLARASTSIVLNIAEGAGKFSKADKRRDYLSALGSATECAAIHDVCQRVKVVELAVGSRGKEMLDRIVAMVVRLCKSLQRDGAGGGAGAGAGS